MPHPSSVLIDTRVFLEHFLHRNRILDDEYNMFHDNHALIVDSIDFTPYAFIAHTENSRMFNTLKTLYCENGIHDLADALTFAYLVQYFFS